MDLDEAVARYFANEDVAKWLLDDTPVRSVPPAALKRSVVYSVAFGPNAVGAGPHELDIEDMLIVCGTPGHFVVGVIMGLGQPHVFSQSPLMKDRTPLVRRFAVDLSRRACLEFMEFVLFADGKTVVFLRHFLHTPDYTLPVVAASRLYASRGPGIALGHEIMRAAICEKANCPSCKRPSGSCQCIAEQDAGKTPELVLSTHSWTQYAASFIRKARRGWTRFALSADIPHVGPTVLTEAFFPSLTIVSFGDSPYMRIMQRRAVHSLGIGAITPRADIRMSAVATANDYLTMHSAFIMRKRPRKPTSPFTVHSSGASPRAPKPSAGDLPDPWGTLPRAAGVSVHATSDLAYRWQGAVPQIFNPSPLLVPGSAELALDLALNTPVLEDPLVGVHRELTPVFGSGITSNDNSVGVVGVDDFAAIDLAVDCTNPPLGCTAPSALTEAVAAPVIPLLEAPTAVASLPASNVTSWPGSLSLDAAVVAHPAPNPALPPISLPLPPSAAAALRPPRQRAAKRAKRMPSPDTDDERKHGCTRCGARFKMRGDLQRHVRTVHEGKKQHVCPTCNRTFGHSGHLNRHIESMHLNRRKHECKLCGDRFYQASHLQSHISHVHDRKKPFECHICALRLATESGLRNHLRNLHQAEDSFHCPVPSCSAGFVLATDLARHVARQHPQAASRSDSNQQPQTAAGSDSNVAGNGT